MKAKQKAGRPVTSCDTYIIPESRDKPDVSKVGRALIIVARSVLKKKAVTEPTPPIVGEEDGVP